MSSISHPETKQQLFIVFFLSFLIYFFTHSNDTNQPQNQALTQDQTCARMSIGGDSEDLWMNIKRSQYLLITVTCQIN